MITPSGPTKNLSATRSVSLLKALVKAFLNELVKPLLGTLQPLVWASLITLSFHSSAQTDRDSTNSEFTSPDLNFSFLTPEQIVDSYTRTTIGGEFYSCRLLNEEPVTPSGEYLMECYRRSVRTVFYVPRTFKIDAITQDLNDEIRTISSNPVKIEKLPAILSNFRNQNISLRTVRFHLGLNAIGLRRQNTYDCEVVNPNSPLHVACIDQDLISEPYQTAEGKVVQEKLYEIGPQLSVKAIKFQYRSNPSEATNATYLPDGKEINYVFEPYHVYAFNHPEPGSYRSVHLTYKKFIEGYQNIIELGLGTDAGGALAGPVTPNFLRFIIDKNDVKKDSSTEFLRPKTLIFETNNYTHISCKESPIKDWIDWAAVKLGVKFNHFHCTLSVERLLPQTGFSNFKILPEIEQEITYVVLEVDGKTSVIYPNKLTFNELMPGNVCKNPKIADRVAKKFGQGWQTCFVKSFYATKIKFPRLPPNLTRPP